MEIAVFITRRPGMMGGQRVLLANRLDVMKRYMCVICGFIYDEALGIPEQGIMPGTLWKDVPLTWRCPDCAAGKDDFEMMEI